MTKANITYIPFQLSLDEITKRTQSSTHSDHPQYGLILYLSDRAQLLFDHLEIPSSVHLAVVHKSEFRREVQASCTSEKETKIDLLTSSDTTDFVIIQNNFGFGLGKAVSVASPLREKSCIYWARQVPPSNVDADPNASTFPYDTLGYRQFFNYRWFIHHLERLFHSQKKIVGENNEN